MPSNRKLFAESCRPARLEFHRDQREPAFVIGASFFGRADFGIAQQGLVRGLALQNR